MSCWMFTFICGCWTAFCIYIICCRISFFTLLRTPDPAGGTLYAGAGGGMVPVQPRGGSLWENLPMKKDEAWRKKGLPEGCADAVKKPGTTATQQARFTGITSSTATDRNRCTQRAWTAGTCAAAGATGGCRRTCGETVVYRGKLPGGYSSPAPFAKSASSTLSAASQLIFAHKMALPSYLLCKQISMQA